jgi:hypothetical protein
LDSLSGLSSEEHAQLKEAVGQKLVSCAQKWKWLEKAENEHRVARRVKETFDGHAEPNMSECFHVATHVELLECIRAFIQHTSNVALALAVCAVYARELLVQEEGIERVSLSTIPNLDRLVPQDTHPHHDILEGHLLVRSSVQGNGDAATASIFQRCLKSLRSVINKPPELLLANQMWIGPVPWQLQILTLPK